MRILLRVLPGRGDQTAYYERDPSGLPRRWLQLMRRTNIEHLYGPGRDEAVGKGSALGGAAPRD